MELPPTLGVYLSMFEQSILIDHPSPRKAGAFAASLMAQIVLGGVCLLIPLIYNQTLLILPPAAQLQMPQWSTPTPPPAEVLTPDFGPSTALPVPRIFRAPTTVPSKPPVDHPVTLDAAPDAVALVTPGPSSVIGIPNGETLRITPPVEKPIVKEPTPVATAPTTPIRMSSALQSAKLMKRVRPENPSSARLTHVSGVVHLLGIIAKDGHIRELKVLDGHPLLRKAAVDAVSQWIYSPTLLGGQPVEVEAPIDVNFYLK
jgi:protein TonB